MELLILGVLVIIAAFIIRLYFRIDRYFKDQIIFNLDNIKKAYPSSASTCYSSDDPRFLSHEDDQKRRERIGKVIKRTLDKI